MKPTPRRLVRFIQKQVMRRPITAVLFLLSAVYLLATILIAGAEKIDFGQATTMILPAVLGELGIVESNSGITQISCLAALVVSVAFLAIVTAKITSSFIEFIRRGGSIVKKVKLSGHVIVCGWNAQGDNIVGELLNSNTHTDRGIVILANCERRPVEDERVEFVQGDPTQDEALIRAGVKTAESVIVLSDLTRRANEADAEALMIVLAVESINRDVHTSVQIMNSANRVHLERAHADEIICIDQMGGHLVVSATLNHGVSSVVRELLTFNAGSEFYRYDRPLSDNMLGKEFCEIVHMLAEQRILLLGFETDDSEELRRMLTDDVLHSAERGERVIVVNPQAQYKIRQGDALFIIAESEPSRL